MEIISKKLSIMARRVRAAALGLGLAVLLVIGINGEAQGYEIYVTQPYNKPIGWASEKLEFTFVNCSIDPYSPLGGSYRNAMTQWNWVEGMKDRFSWSERSCSPNPAAGDRRNDVFWTSWGANKGKTGTAAMTYRFAPNSDGTIDYEMVEADVMFNIDRRTANDTYSSSGYPCDGDFSTGGEIDPPGVEWRRLALHELGHVVGIGHDQGSPIPSVMRPSTAVLPYCGVLPIDLHPDERNAGRLAVTHGTTAESVDLAVSSYGRENVQVFNGIYAHRPLRVSGGSYDPNTDRYVAPFCIGDSYDFQFAISNRGTEDVVYDRKFYYSDDEWVGYGGSDILLATEVDRLKSPGARYGFWDGNTTLLTVPSSVTEDETYFAGLRVFPTTDGDLFQSDNSTYFRDRIEVLPANECP